MEHEFPKLAEVEDGKPRIKDNPPLIFHLESQVKHFDKIVRDAFRRHGAIEVSTQGDSFFAAVPMAVDAVSASVGIQRAMSEAKGNQGPSATTSIMKNAGSRIGQERSELLIEIMWQQGLGWDGEGFTKDEIETVRAWLGGKATTIYGGSAEIQNNIIAKRILGLLDHQ